VDQLYTIEDVLDAEQEYRNQRKGWGRSWQQEEPQREEVIPEWFDEYERKRKGVG